jgi:UDP-N-acetylmuramate: L-alanyl-gamma-D-glutamyl-meso-diaminopimelate ligase
MDLERILDVYCIAIGGTGMAPFACLMQEAGHRVRGSDGPLYPPMSTLLERAGIRPHVGWDPAHLEPPPDLVVVGNAVPRDNLEARATEAAGLPRVSMPEALHRFFLSDRRPLVVAGTHGKTTTTALAAWVWASCGRDPGYLIGGMPADLPASFHRGTGDRFILEGDEYNAAYFDRGPKFLHYRPQTLILTSVEYDHADLYPDPEALLAAYRELVRGLPGDGLLAAWGDSGQVREIAAEASCPVVLYGTGEDNDVRPAEPPVFEARGTRLRVEDPVAGQVDLTLRVPGRHNLWNALAVWAVAVREELPIERVVTALETFEGTARRLQELGRHHGITVVDDFAHHPTAVARSLEALRQKYPGQRLTVLFEPRSLTAGRRRFQKPYREAFRGADRVLLAPIFHARRLEEHERLDLAALRRELEEDGVDAGVCGSVDEILDRAVGGARPQDVMVTMSSGSFEGLPQRLLEAIRTLL